MNSPPLGPKPKPNASMPAYLSTPAYGSTPAYAPMPAYLLNGGSPLYQSVEEDQQGPGRRERERERGELRGAIAASSSLDAGRRTVDLEGLLGVDGEAGATAASGSAGVVGGGVAAHGAVQPQGAASHHVAAGLPTSPTYARVRASHSFDLGSKGGKGAHKALTMSHPHLAENARDPRDEAPKTPVPSRPASPYTLNPPIDFDGLSWPSSGTRERLEATPEQAEERLKKLSGAVKTILECLGEDPEREGLLGTPERYAKAMLYFTKGYEENVRDIVNGAVFHEDHDEMVIVKDIEVFSLCEHHLVPFTGKMHIGYIPNRRVIGLSKLARIAEMFSRRLQVQERLTKQVALALSEILKPQGVAVVMESSHLCMVMRGVQKASAITTTSCMLGCMRSRDRTREEFLNLLKR